MLIFFNTLDIRFRPTNPSVPLEFGHMTTPILPGSCWRSRRGGETTGGSELPESLSAHWQSSVHVLCNWSWTSLSIVLRILGSGAGQEGGHKGLIIKEAATWKVSGGPPALG